MSPFSGDPVIQTLFEALDHEDVQDTLLWGRGLKGLSRALDAETPVYTLLQDARDPLSTDGQSSYGILAPRSDFARVITRVPRSKEALRWRLRAAASALPAGGQLWLAGHQREGIKSARKVMEELVGETQTVHTKRRCRVLVAHRRDEACHVPSLKEEAKRLSYEFGGQTIEGVTLPGVFAHGRLDEGTRRFLEWCGTQRFKGRVLDLGAGAGLIGIALSTLERVKSVHMVDSAWVAVESMRRSIAANGERISCPISVEHADVGDAEKGGYDVIVTNPPFHDGREEDRQLIARFALAAARRMRPRGRFYAVCNTHLAYRDALSTAFSHVEVSWHDTRFRVWTCAGPKA